MVRGHLPLVSTAYLPLALTLSRQRHQLLQVVLRVSTRLKLRAPGGMDANRAEQAIWRPDRHAGDRKRGQMGKRRDRREGRQASRRAAGKQVDEGNTFMVMHTHYVSWLLKVAKC